MKNTETTTLPPFPHRIGFAFCIAIIGIQLSMEYIAQYGLYFLHPPGETGRTVYVALGLISVVFVAGRIFDAISDLVIGAVSDHFNAHGKRRWLPQGRRRPFIFLGSFPLILTSIAFWYPPSPEESTLNFIWTLVVLLLHWLFLTCCTVPLYALGPELMRHEKHRVQLGAWVGVGTTIGVFLAIALAGELVTVLDPARAQDSFSPTGYQRVAGIFALLTFLGFQWVVWTVKENPEEAQAATIRLKDILHSLRNPLFIRYFSIFLVFNIGFLAPQHILPHWTEIGLGGDEGTIALVMLPYLVLSLIASGLATLFNRILSPVGMMKLSILLVGIALPWMYAIGAADLPTDTKVLLAQCTFAVAGFGNGLLYVIVFPLLGQIIDQDQVVQGTRWDALFMAFNNITLKAGIALSIVVATVALRLFGNSVSEPMGILIVGPIGGLFCGLALVLALRYPQSTKV